MLSQCIIYSSEYFNEYSVVMEINMAVLVRQMPRLLLLSLEAKLWGKSKESFGKL